MNYKFTNRQLCLMLYCVTVGYGVMNLPKTSAEVAGTGGWISMAIATLLYSVIISIVVYLQYSFENETIYEYSIKLVGKTITAFFTIILIIYFFIIFTFLPRLYCNAINLTILDKTPVKYISILFFIVLGYAILKGINTISRLIEIYAIISIVNFILINALLCTQGKLTNIKPLFVSSDWFLYLKGAFKMILPILGGETLLFIPINKEKNEHILKHCLLTVLFIGIFYIFIIETTISVTGVESVIRYRTTLFSTIRGFDIPYLEFFRRLDGYYIVIWTLNLVCTCSIWGYGVTFFINKLFKNAQYKYIVICLTIIGYITSQVPKNISQVESILDLTVNFGIIVYLLIPLTLFIVKKVRNL